MAENKIEVTTLCDAVISEVERAIVGKTEVLKKIMTAVLAGGHILLEDYPGLGKTLIAKSFATALSLDFKRIQFTPDLLPGDITGGYIYDRSTSRFLLRKGPIFTNIILADEINRASPKTQSALLEAMQEGQVTLEGETHKLPVPFIVMATQNPIEYEGTFPLPEAQLDRFLMRLSIGYPTIEDEQEILKRRKIRQQDEIDLNHVTNRDQVMDMRQAIEKIHMEPDIERYIVELVHKTREEPRVNVGASPRGSLALSRLSMAYAAMEGRDYVIPDDVKAFAIPVLIHRLILMPELWMHRNALDNVIKTILDSVSVPIINEV